MAMKRQSARMLTEAMVGAGLSKWDAEALVNNFMVRNYRLTKGTIPAQDDIPAASLHSRYVPVLIRNGKRYGWYRRPQQI